MRAGEKEKEKQAQRISALEQERCTAPVPTPKLQTSPDMDFYIAIAENAKKRAELLERENLQVSLLPQRANAVAGGTRGEKDRKHREQIAVTLNHVDDLKVLLLEGPCMHPLVVCLDVALDPLQA